MSPDHFMLAGETFGSRLLLGTAGYPTQRMLIDAVAAGGCERTTEEWEAVLRAGRFRRRGITLVHGSAVIEAVWI